MPIATILLDIEGTICPISFVKDVMYPFALDALRDELRPFLASEEGSSSTPPVFPPASLAPYIPLFPAGAAASASGLLEHVAALTAADTKDSALKALQGHLWRAGFEGGRLRAPLFPDVRPALAAWDARGARLAVFSSGSVAAQRLFLAHTGTVGEEEDEAAGDGIDVSGLFGERLFDTVNAGPKMEAASYRAIARALAVAEDEVLFLSDNVREVRAAREAGMEALVVDRPGNAPLSEQDQAELGVVTSFDDARLQELVARPS